MAIFVDSCFRLMSITAFYIFDLKVTGIHEQGWVPKPSRVPSGVWTRNLPILNAMPKPTRPFSPTVLLGLSFYKYFLDLVYAKSTMCNLVSDLFNPPKILTSCYKLMLIGFWFWLYSCNITCSINTKLNPYNHNFSVKTII